MPLFITSEMKDLQKEIAGAEAEFYKLNAASDTTKEELAEAAEKVVDLREEFEEMKRQNIADFINKVGDTLSGALSKGFKAVSGVVKKAIQDNNQYFQSLNQIVGINGKVGELGETFKDLAGGLVGKQDLADFFGKTGDIIAGADAMEQQAKYAKDLITAYGSVETAASKYRNIMLLSVEDQKTALELAERQAKIVEQSTAGQVQAIQKTWSDAMDQMGQSLLYTLKPIIDFIGDVAEAFSKISGTKAIDDQTAALKENLTLSEEELRVQEELNEIERLGATGFTSSLDEVHEVGSAFVEAYKDEGDKAQEAADDVIDAEKRKQDAMGGTNEKAEAIAETLDSIFGIVQSLGEIFTDVFSNMETGLLDVVALLLEGSAEFVKWLDSIGMLKPLLTGLTAAILAVKAAQLTLAAANALAAVTGIAATGPAAIYTAGIVGSAVAIGVGLMSSLGLNVGEASSPTPDQSQPETASNDYSGTANESGRSTVNVYLDGKKVNDELANEDYFNTEVKIS